MAMHRGFYESDDLNKHIYLPLVREVDILSYLDHFGELASTVIEDKEGNKVTIYSEVTRTVHGKNVMWLVRKSSNGEPVLSVNTNRFDNKQDAVKVAVQLIGGRENIYDWY